MMSPAGSHRVNTVPVVISVRIERGWIRGKSQSAQVKYLSLDIRPRHNGILDVAVAGVLPVETSGLGTAACRGACPAEASECVPSSVG